MEYIYGKLNKEVEEVNYTGLDTKTAKTTVDNYKKTIKVDVIEDSINAIVFDEPQVLTEQQLTIVHNNLQLDKYVDENDTISTLKSSLNNAITTTKKINLEEGDSPSTIKFTDYDGNVKTFVTGHPVDDNYIVLNDSEQITLGKVNVDGKTIIGNGNELNPLKLNIDNKSIVYQDGLADSKVKCVGLVTESNSDKFISSEYIDNSITQLSLKSSNLESRVKGIGGYLTAYNFTKADPTQEELDAYALSQINNDPSKEAIDRTGIFDQTKVKNLFDHHIWVFTNDLSSEPSWTDQGIEYINTASNTGVQGVVTGSYAKWEGFVDLKGHISINGLEQFASDIYQFASDIETQKANKMKFETLSLSTWTTLLNKTPYKFETTVTASTTLSNDCIVELFNDNPVMFSTYGFMINSIEGQNITIYCIKQPEASMSIKIGVQE